jgi:hypothetical protein
MKQYQRNRTWILPRQPWACYHVNWSVWSPSSAMGWNQTQINVRFPRHRPQEIIEEYISWIQRQLAGYIYTIQAVSCVQVGCSWINPDIWQRVKTLKIGQYGIWNFYLMLAIRETGRNEFWEIYGGLQLKLTRTVGSGAEAGFDYVRSLWSNLYDLDSVFLEDLRSAIRHWLISLVSECECLVRIDLSISTPWHRKSDLSLWFLENNLSLCWYLQRTWAKLWDWTAYHW